MAPAQYGANIAAVGGYLLHWHLIPEERWAELRRDVFGVDLSPATLAARAQRKAEEGTELADHSGAQVKQAPVKHLDETGRRIAGVWQWLHGASTWLLTWDRTSRQRGTRPEGVLGIIVPDFWRPYFTLAGVTHALGNAHHLRELKALSESEPEPWARARSRFLRQACPAANLARQRNEGLPPAFLDWLSARYDRIVAQGLAFHEGQPPLETLGRQRRGRSRRRPGHTLLLRLQGHKDDALRFLTNPDVPFTNNQAERDLRMRKLKQKISGCFRAETGAHTFAPLRTVLSTARKQGWNVLNTLSQPSAPLIRNLRTA
jgi:transposase